jgi:hypothetical protein
MTTAALEVIFQADSQENSHSHKRDDQLTRHNHHSTVGQKEPACLRSVEEDATRHGETKGV